MSIVTTQPIPAPTTSTAELSGGGADLSHRDDTGVNATRRVERRRNGGQGESPMDMLTRMPAVVVLERLPVPALAMVRDGTILFANTAFAEMVGHRQEQLPGLAFGQVFNTVPATLFAISGVDALANLIVQLKHCEGWAVRARMSKSALMRHDDPIVLVTFEDLTERLWDDDR